MKLVFGGLLVLFWTANVAAKPFDAMGKCTCAFQLLEGNYSLDSAPESLRGLVSQRPGAKIYDTYFFPFEIGGGAACAAAMQGNCNTQCSYFEVAEKISDISIVQNWTCI